MAIAIEPAQFPDDAEAIRFLFSRYAKSLSIDLTFQHFQYELDSLPGKYTESQGGALLIAHSGEKGTVSNSQLATAIFSETPSSHVPYFSVLGCVALRRSSDGWCEMKRLYVVEEARGEKLGGKLMECILRDAKVMGYRGIRLDSLPEMEAAQKLYRKYGFVEIPPYYDTPVEGTVFMGLDFSRS